jgi:hypothetical protein
MFPGVEVGTGRGLVTVAPAKGTRTPGPRLLAHRPGIVATVPLDTAEQRRDASPALLVPVAKGNTLTAKYETCTVRHLLIVVMSTARAA